MAKLSRIVGATCVAAALTLAPLPALAADGPLDLTGDLDGVAYEIRVPADWNGTLVMYAHGYRDAADHPGETDDHSAQAFANNVVEDQLLAAGYAVAGSAYASNGWAVKDGIHDTKELVNYFQDVVGQPKTTLLAGFSMGSLVAYESIEKYGGVYDGAMPSCSVGAGAPRAWDGSLAVATAYDAVFGWPAAWGTTANRVAAVPGPRRYVERYADYTGNVDGPVLTLGTTTDSLVPPAHISAYDATVAAAGTSDLVAHAWTSGVGHCNFTPTQLVTGVRALDSWVKTGVRPTDFPADQGFVSYTPPPWPQP